MTDFPPGSGYQPQNHGYQPPPSAYPHQDPGYQPQGSRHQPPAPGYPMPRQQKVRPGRAWYLLALAIFAAGAGWLAYGLVSLAGAVSDLQRVPLPGGGTVNLTHGGGYTVYYEGPGAQSGNFRPFNIHVAPASPASPGAAVSGLTRYGSTVTYNIGSRQGRAVLTLHVTGAGTFAVTTRGAPASGADLAFGGSIGNGIVGALLPAIPLIILGILGALVLLIVRIAGKRSLWRRRARGGAGG